MGGDSYGSVGRSLHCRMQGRGNDSHSLHVDNAMIVVCYEDGQPAHSHQMTRSMCIDYWTKWLQRLHAFWMNKFSLKPEARK
ncbi:hypothetical protein LSH36_56g07017 [Paralvinella palmiformis]|uniref:Uncharacterized protein n=1 Tax=Paralvinella palmiformis TaxID=53620 RepID=A0AAD9NCK4_9ANNE|nr:hypothetical protein LSH36_56g07017 [Paralvinella palmiformis]